MSATAYYTSSQSLFFDTGMLIVYSTCCSIASITNMLRPTGVVELSFQVTILDDPAEEPDEVRPV